MTLLAIFFAYHLNWIRQRHAILDSGVISDSQSEPREAPGLLPLFGEQGYSTLYFTRPAPHSEHLRIQSLFSETDFPQGVLGDGK